MKYKEPVVGIEPTTGRLRSVYSTSELHRLAKTLVVKLPLCSAAELHRLVICPNHILSTLAAHQEAFLT